jgi:catechol 2,3-dioxygenase
MTNSIDPATRMGRVWLTVRDLGRSLDYYQRALGFRVFDRENGTAYLGPAQSPAADANRSAALLVLEEERDALPRPARSTGLYHFAILVPSRLALARSLRRLEETSTPLQGYSDHLVSEALYLADPDDNGIEIYRDRPRSDWYDAQGRFRMASDPLDLSGIMGELAGQDDRWQGLEAGTTIGHVHLNVADLQTTEALYAGVLGFDVMAQLGDSALFISAGGYHHHLGLNTWTGRGAPPPPVGSVGLRHYEIVLPTPGAVAAVVERLREANVDFAERDNAVYLRDPSQNGIVLVVENH